MRQEKTVSRSANAGATVAATGKAAKRRSGDTRAAAAPPADPAIAAWLRRSLAADPPRARSLIVTVWGDSLAPRGGGAWLSALIALMAPFGINERLVRTSVFRLAQDGWVQARAEGRRSRYSLTADGRRRIEQAQARIYAFDGAEGWDGEWEVAVIPAESGDAAARAALRDELGWAGFGAFAPGVLARPARNDDTLARTLRALGFAGRVRVLRARDASGAGITGLADGVRGAWDLDGVAAGYRRFATAYGRGRAAFESPAATPSPEQAYAARTLLIHAWRRTLLRDPGLPAVLLPGAWPGHDAATLARGFRVAVHAAAEAHLDAALA